MAGLLPFLIALTILETAALGQRASFTFFATVIPWALLVWWLLCETVGHLLPRYCQTRRGLDRWDIIAQTLIIGVFAGLCYGLGWNHRVSGYTTTLAPWLAMMVIHWWCLAKPTAIIRGFPWTRWAFLSYHVRFSLLPLMIAWPILDVCLWIGNHSPIGPWLMSHFGQAANVAGTSLMALGLITFLPWLLVRIWGAQPLANPSLVAELEAECQRSGVRVAAILHWPIGGGRIYNAMVLGVLPRLRYVLFTEDLLRDFTAAERSAVLGHELGHARHHHLWIYLMFALATGLLAWSVRDALHHTLDSVPGISALTDEIRAGMVALILLAVQWRLLFGMLSRACERQADLAGADLAGRGDTAAGAHIMHDALGAVARFAGIDPRSPSWRHYSIAERMRFLKTVAADAGIAARHHARLRLAVQLLAMLTGVLLALATMRIL
jgi:Zn-dependent protease with chaperone function